MSNFTVKHVVDVQSKNCIITIGSSNCKYLTYTLSLMCDYAFRTHTDLKVITSYDMKNQKITPNCQNQSTVVKMCIIHDFLSLYDRIIYIDNTCCISHDTPNLFSLVNEDEIGAQHEGLLKYIPTFQKDYQLIKDKFSYQINRSKYINTSVIVLSKQHRYLFDKKNINHYQSIIRLDPPRQAYLNYLVQKNEVKLKLLDVIFNNQRVFKNRFDNEQYSQKLVDKNYILSNYIFNVTNFYNDRLFYIKQISNIYKQQNILHVI